MRRGSNALSVELRYPPSIPDRSQSGEKLEPKQILVIQVARPFAHCRNGNFLRLIGSRISELPRGGDIGSRPDFVSRRNIPAPSDICNRRDSRKPSKNVWRAPFASGFRRHGLTSLLQRIRSRDQFSRPRWRSAHSGPNKPCRRRYAIFLTRVPEYRSTVRPSRFPPPANLRRSISA